jgi:molybdate transport repressor ModE-like protein
MDPRRIQYFFAVVEHGNLSSAAQALRVSQPTLSRQIQAIEERFQTPLFVRGGRGGYTAHTPTHGRDLVDAARGAGLGGCRVPRHVA